MSRPMIPEGSPAVTTGGMDSGMVSYASLSSVSVVISFRYRCPIFWPPRCLSSQPASLSQSRPSDTWWTFFLGPLWWWLSQSASVLPWVLSEQVAFSRAGITCASLCRESMTRFNYPKFLLSALSASTNWFPRYPYQAHDSIYRCWQPSVSFTTDLTFFLFKPA